MVSKLRLFACHSKHGTGFFFASSIAALQDAISLQAECEHTAEWEKIQCNATTQRLLLRETARQDDDLRRLG